MFFAERQTLPDYKIVHDTVKSTERKYFQQIKLF